MKIKHSFQAQIKIITISFNYPEWREAQHQVQFLVIAIEINLHKIIRNDERRVDVESQLAILIEIW